MVVGHEYYVGVGQPSVSATKLLNAKLTSVVMKRETRHAFTINRFFSLLCVVCDVRFRRCITNPVIGSVIDALLRVLPNSSRVHG